MRHKIVRHVNQNFTEFWAWDSRLCEYVQVTTYIADDWARDSFICVELMHNMDIKKDGYYGHVIIS
jgi:hypothetical protein